MGLGTPDRLQQEVQGPLRSGRTGAVVTLTQAVQVQEVADLMGRSQIGHH